jgi:hypothetical protein
LQDFFGVHALHHNTNLWTFSARLSSPLHTLYLGEVYLNIFSPPAETS